MNPYDSARLTEAKGMAVLAPFLSQEMNGRLVLLEKGPLARALQETTGDAIMQTPDRRAWSVEVKVEERDDYGNLFLETWSNKNLDDADRRAQYGSNPGWLLKLRSDLLLYYFLDADKLCVMSLFRLQQWAFGCKDNGNVARLYDFKEKRQGRRMQANDSWGRCVPIQTLAQEVGLRIVYPRQLSWLPDAGITHAISDTARQSMQKLRQRWRKERESGLLT